MTLATRKLGRQGLEVSAIDRRLTVMLDDALLFDPIEVISSLT